MSMSSRELRAAAPTSKATRLLLLIAAFMTVWVVLSHFLAKNQDPPKIKSHLYYKVSGVPGTPVHIEYYGGAWKPGDRRFARDLISRDAVIPPEGFLRFWGDSEPSGIASISVLNKGAANGSCVHIEIQIDERTLQRDDACLKSYATFVRTQLPAEN